MASRHGSGGGNDGVNMYVYNPSNFNVNYAKTAGSVNAANVVGLSDFVNKIAGITPSTDTPLAPNYDANEHNKILRGNDITNYFTSGKMSAALQKGNFSNIYPGDMIIFPNEKEEGGYRTWIVGDCDYFWGNKESVVTKHHVLMANKFPIIHQKFVDLPGHKGYLDSDVWKNKLPAIFNAINSLFKGHILPHKELLVSRYSPSRDMSKNDEKGEYAATTVNLFSNTMLGIKDYNGRSETAVQIGNTAKTVSYFRMSPGSITPQHRDDQSTNFSLLRSVSYSNGAPWRNHIDYTGNHGGEGVGERSFDYCYFVYFLLY